MHAKFQYETKKPIKIKTKKLENKSSMHSVPNAMTCVCCSTQPQPQPQPQPQLQPKKKKKQKTIETKHKIHIKP